MPKIDVWPWEIDKLDSDKGVTRFKSVVATVEGVFTQYGFGLSFREDTGKTATGQKPIWSMQGPWNEAENKPDPYEGFKPAKGARVAVVLSVKDAVGKDGKPRVYHNILDMALPGAQPSPELAGEHPAQSEAQERPAGAIGPGEQIPAEWLQPRQYYENKTKLERQSIERQVATKLLVELAIAHKGGPQEGYYLDWAEHMLEELSQTVNPNKVNPVRVASPPTDAESLPWDGPELKT